MNKRFLNVIEKLKFFINNNGSASNIVGNNGQTFYLKFMNENKQKFHKFYNQQSTFNRDVLRKLFNNIRIKFNETQFMKYIFYFNNKSNFFVKLRQRSKRLAISYSAVACTFSWDEQRITNDELNKYLHELLNEFNDDKSSSSTDKNQKKPDITLFSSTLTKLQKRQEQQQQDATTSQTPTAHPTENTNHWETIFTQKDLIIWRRRLDPHDPKLSYLYEYKVYGRLYDVSPFDFFRTQLDLDYRKVWDHLVVSLRIVSTDEQNNSELVHWIMKFPFPMNSREYLFVRRYCIDPNERLLVLVSSSITNENMALPIASSNTDSNKQPQQPKPQQKEHHQSSNQTSHGMPTHHHEKHQQHHNQHHHHSPHSSYHPPHQQAPYVRVTRYKSNMIIKPHGDFYEPGLDYILQYYDDPKARIPNMAYKWMATSGLPDWLDKLHNAAKNIPKTDKKIENFPFYNFFDANNPTVDNSSLNGNNKTTEENQNNNNNNSENSDKNDNDSSNDENKKPPKKKRIHHSDTEPHPALHEYY